MISQDRDQTFSVEEGTCGRDPGVSVGLVQATQALARDRRTEKCSSDKCSPAESVTALEPFHPRAGQETFSTSPDRVI